MHSETALSNVVLITVDSLRADAISPYHENRRTLVMDSLADRGTVFEGAFVTGNRTPFSFPSIQASCPVFADTGRIGVEGATTLASVLSEAGVSTGDFNAADGSHIENVDQETNELSHRPTGPTQRSDVSVNSTAARRRVRERFGSITREHANARRNRNRQQVDTVDGDLERRLEALGYR